MPAEVFYALQKAASHALKYLYETESNTQDAYSLSAEAIERYGKRHQDMRSTHQLPYGNFFMIKWMIRITRC